MNEPAPANPAREPFLFMPGYFDDKYLAPFYNKIFETYYKNDPSKLMWFMPTQVPDYIGVYQGYNFPVGFVSVPGTAAGPQKN